MQIHRFRDAAAIALAGKGETRYMTADEAEKAGKALLAVAASIRREPFGKSSGLTVAFATEESSLGIKSGRAVDMLLCWQVTNRAEAEGFLRALQAAGLGYHFDDGAVDCLHGNGLVTKAEAEAINGKVALCYDAWRASGADLQTDCPLAFLSSLDEGN